MGAHRLPRPRVVHRRQRPQAFERPQGQTRRPAPRRPRFGPCQRLDYELELGVFVGTGNALGEPMPMDAGRGRTVFGVVLLNDWSARDIQAWEYQPLGPFLAKNFATTISPWIVTREALAPFRAPFTRPAGDPQPLPYLDSARNRDRGAIDITLRGAGCRRAAMRKQGRAAAAPVAARTSATPTGRVAQLLAHHTSNGCNLQTGDLLGTGTSVRPAPGQGGSLLELSLGGKQPLALARRRDAQLPAGRRHGDPARPLRAPGRPAHRFRGMSRHRAAGAGLRRLATGPNAPRW